MEIIKTIKPSGGDYTSLAAWEAGEQTDLVSAGNIAIAECYAMEDNTRVGIDGWVTDTDNYILIRGYSGDKTESNTGRWSTDRYRRITTATGNIAPSINIRTTCVKIQDLQIKHSSVTYTNSGGILCRTGALHVTIERCIIIQGTSSETGAFSDGVQVNDTSQNTNLFVINCIIYGFKSTSCAGVTINLTGGTCYAYSTTVVNCYWGIVRYANGTCIAKNCYASASNNDYNGTITLTTCASSDATGSAGLQNIAYTTDNFVNVNAGSEDLHLSSGSALLEVGTDTSGDSAPLNFTDDIDGNTRTGTWDIGADKYVDSAIQASVGEIISVSDYFNAAATIGLTVLETVSTTDTTSTVKTSSSSITESVSTTDTIGTVNTTVASTDEFVTVTDASNGEITSAIQASVGESISVSDYFNAAATYQKQTAELCSAVDLSEAALADELIVTESAVVSDSAAAVVIVAASVTETVLPADILSCAKTTTGSIVESVTPSETNTASSQFTVSALELCGAVDGSDATFTVIVAVINEHASAADVAAATAQTSVSVSDDIDIFDLSSTNYPGEFIVYTDPYLIVDESITDRDVNETDIIRFNSRDFEILTIEDVQERNFEKWISCKERRV